MNKKKQDDQCPNFEQLPSRLNVIPPQSKCFWNLQTQLILADCGVSVPVVKPSEFVTGGCTLFLFVRICDLFFFVDSLR